MTAARAPGRSRLFQQATPWALAALATALCGLSLIMILAATRFETLPTETIAASHFASPLVRLVIALGPAWLTIVFDRGTASRGLALAGAVALTVLSLGSAPLALVWIGATSRSAAGLALLAATIVASFMANAGILAALLATSRAARLAISFAFAVVLGLGAPRAGLDLWELLDQAAQGHADAAVAAGIAAAALVPGLLLSAIASRLESRAARLAGACLALLLLAPPGLAAEAWRGRFVISLESDTLLSVAARAALRDIPRDATITLVSGTGAGAAPARDAMAAVADAACGRVRIDEIDALRAPARSAALLASGAGLAPRGSDVVVARSGEARSDLVLDASPFADAAQLADALAARVLAVTRGTARGVLWTNAHGERPPPPVWREAMERAGIAVRTDGLAGAELSNAGSITVVVAAPRVPWSRADVAALAAVLAAGGSAVVFLDPALAPGGAGFLRTGLEATLEGHAVALPQAWIVDDSFKTTAAIPNAIMGTIRGRHEAARALAELPLILHAARPVRTASDAELLAETHADAWGETDLRSLEAGPGRGEGDLAGPLSLAIARVLPSGGRLAVVGSGDLVDARGSARGANGHFAVDLTLWAQGETRVASLADPARPPRRYIATANDLRVTALICLLFAPGVLVLPALLFRAIGRTSA